MIDYTTFDPFGDEAWKRKVMTDPVVQALGDIPPAESLRPSVQLMPERQTPTIDPTVVQQAGQEDPFGDQPVRQEAYLRWQQMSPEDRALVFNQAIEQAMDAEGITDPVQRERWRAAMTNVAKGDDRTPGENPSLNPFAQAYDLDDRPAQGVNPRLVGTPQGDATASSARGYFQFLTKPNGQTPSTWDLVRMPMKDGEEELSAESVFDPVSNARGYIRAVNRSTNYQGPEGPYEEKKRIKVWNPMLPLPPGLQR